MVAMTAHHHNATFAIGKLDAQKRPVRRRPIADVARTVYTDCMSLNAIDIEQSRERIGMTAKAMLSGECSYIEGVRTICGLLPGARIDQFAEPFVTLVAVDSETDAVPVGRFRELWHPDAKIKFEAKWNEAENYAKSVGEPACRAAIAWVERHPTYGS
jgi:hypothetical protein